MLQLIKVKVLLKKLADEKGYEEFVIPDDVGRKIFCFNSCWFTSIAVAGISIDDLMVWSTNSKRRLFKRFQFK